MYTLDLPPATSTRFELSWTIASTLKSQRPALDSGTCPPVGRFANCAATQDRLTFSPYAADFVFIDGSHTYDYVMNDSMAALALLPSGGGIIAWHDYGAWPGVTEALNAAEK